MSTNEPKTPQAVAEAPQPAPTLTPEAIVQQLRAIRAQIGELTPLTPAQRKALRDVDQHQNDEAVAVWRGQGRFTHEHPLRLPVDSIGTFVLNSAVLL